jgi:prepilin-type N-terminal cleavage/methylation domain-containing protein
MQNAECGVRNGGVTLVELIVVLAIIGLVVGVSGLALASLQAPRESVWVRELRRARAEAIRTGRPVEIRDDRSPLTAHALFLPDGRVLGAGLDPLTGTPVE